MADPNYLGLFVCLGLPIAAFGSAVGAACYYARSERKREIEENPINNDYLEGSEGNLSD